MKATTPSKVLPPIVAARDWLISQPCWEPWQPLIDRLAKAPIWKQLNRRDPVMPHPQLAAWSKMRFWGGVLNGSDRDVATQIVFLKSVFFGSAESETSTVAEYKKNADSYRVQAERLRTEAKELEEARRRNKPDISFSPDPAASSARAQALRLIGLRGQAEENARAIERAAAWCEAEADWMMDIGSDPNHPSHPLLVERHQGPAHVRVYCMQLAEITRLLYDDVLYGIVASIATVALSQNVPVTKANVRYWCG